MYLELKPENIRWVFIWTENGDRKYFGNSALAIFLNLWNGKHYTSKNT